MILTGCSTSSGASSRSDMAVMCLWCASSRSGNPPSGLGPTCNLLSASSTRSRIPARPKPDSTMETCATRGVHRACCAPLPSVPIPSRRG